MKRLIGTVLFIAGVIALVYALVSAGLIALVGVALVVIGGKLRG